jgi:hypothetical protein
VNRQDDWRPVNYCDIGNLGAA